MVFPFHNIKSYLDQIDRRIVDCLQDVNPVILENVTPYILDQGKRVRPSLVYLSALACSSAISAECHQYALVTELIHTASLFHDDVLDNAELRRGRPAANRLLGNDTAVLIGDLLYVKALTLMETETLQRRRSVYRAVTAMTHAEIFQGLKRFVVLTEDEYFSVIRGKTAGLISLSCNLGASISGKKRWIDALTRFGELLGLAFQIIDDLLDWTGGYETGKDTLCDIREGRITLPVIRLLQTMNSIEQSRCLNILTNRIDLHETDVTDSYVRLIRTRGIEDEIRSEAKELLNTACHLLEILPDSPYRTDLIDLSRQVIDRTI